MVAKMRIGERIGRILVATAKSSLFRKCPILRDRSVKYSICNVGYRAGTSPRQDPSIRRNIFWLCWNIKTTTPPIARQLAPISDALAEEDSRARRLNNVYSNHLSSHIRADLPIRRLNEQTVDTNTPATAAHLPIINGNRRLYMVLTFWIVYSLTHPFRQLPHIHTITPSIRGDVEESASRCILLLPN